MDSEFPEEPRTSRTKTAEQPRAGRKCTIDLDDPDSLAEFLMEIARVVRDKKRITVTIE